MKAKRIFLLLFFSAIILLVFLLLQPLEVYLGRNYIDVLFPKGPIGAQQLNLLITIQWIMLLVVIPVFILTYLFTWKYSALNPKGKYDPDLDHNNKAEFIWWGIPLIIVTAISIHTWIETHRLDPYRPIESENPPIKIQAVALQWNWLFIYPEEKIASLNYLQIPVKTPIHFEITADAPMNSLWIPKLGGQIYAMPKMRTELFLLADETGDFRGSSANISGKGFAGMHFITRSSSEEDYKTWIESAKQSSNILGFDEYTKVAEPHESTTTELYQLEDENLFEKILAKFMFPKQEN